MNIITSIINFIYSIIEYIFIKVIVFGKIPNHIAFIMDGNRRWAINNNLNRNIGHINWYKKVEDILNWCRILDIHEITIFAFSIENFKRTQDEIDDIMNLADEKFKNMIKSPSVIDKYECNVRVVGDLKLLPKKVQQSAENLMNYSKKYKK